MAESKTSKQTPKKTTKKVAKKTTAKKAAAKTSKTTAKKAAPKVTKKTAKATTKKSAEKVAKKPTDPKELFRLALERKKQQHAHDNAGPATPGQEHGKPDTHAHGAKREFRRKSG